ncbi:MAG: polysaccharide biosynthesis C-terminal domain-containing protein [Desulfohalobiaceae bacterium]
MQFWASLTILCLGQLFNAALGSVSLVLNMTGYDTAKGVGIAAVVSVALNLLLIPLWGVIDSAIATCIALFIWNILLSWPTGSLSAPICTPPPWAGRGHNCRRGAYKLL